MKIIEVISDKTSDMAINELVRYVNEKWNKVGLQVDFGTHFGQRINDERNNPPIDVNEVAKLFDKLFINAGKSISRLPIGFKSVMNDPDTHINVMFKIVEAGGHKVVMLTSIIRKSKFRSDTKVFREELP
jgi:hypothetical protein